MSTRFRKWFLRVVLVAVLMLLVLVLGLQAWLSSGIGKGLVESRLSSTLGRPVRLDGDFSLRLLPLPGVSGTDLRIFTVDGRWLLLDAGAYLARVSLRPLFSGEVEVVALQVEDAAVDIGNLAGEPTQQPEPGAPYFTLPEIQSFELERVSVHFGGMGTRPYLLIEEMSVDDFQLDANAALEAALSLVGDDGEQGTALVNGTLALVSAGTARITVSRLDVAMSVWDVRRLEGEVNAELNRSRLEIALRWGAPDLAFRFEAGVDWDPRFAGEVPGYAIDVIDLRLGEERIRGDGCLIGESPARLNLSLHADALNLGIWTDLLEKWQVPEAGPVGTADQLEFPGQVEPGDAAEPPFDIALFLEVDRSVFEDAVATGSRLRVGADPDCPERL